MTSSPKRSFNSRAVCGRENKTAYTRYVVDFIADLRGMTTEELAAATSANAEGIFGLERKS